MVNSALLATNPPIRESKSKGSPPPVLGATSVRPRSGNAVTTSNPFSCSKVNSVWVAAYANLQGVAGHARYVYPQDRQNSAHNCSWATRHSRLKKLSNTEQKFVCGNPRIASMSPVLRLGESPREKALPSPLRLSL